MRLEQFARRVGDARRARLGRRLVGVAGPRRRPARLDHRRAAGLDGDAPERDGRRGDRPLVLRPEAAAQPDRLRGGAVPVGALRAAGVVALRRRGRRLRGRRGGDRGDRRAHAARADLARALQDGARSSRSSASSRARTKSARYVCLDAYQSAGHGAARRDGARGRVLRRRLGQVAVRRAGRGLAVRAPRSRRAARAGVRRLAGRMRGRSHSSPRWSLRRAPRAS